MKCPYCSEEFSMEVLEHHMPHCKTVHGFDEEAEEQVEDDQATVTDYRSMNLKQIKKILDSREIEYDKNAPKEELIDVLEVDDLSRE